VARSAGRRTGRALRALAVLGVTTVALGLGSPQSPAIPVAATASPAVPAANSFTAAEFDLTLLRPQLPRGYGTVAARAAQAAAEAAAAAVSVAGAQAAAEAAAEAEARALPARPTASVGRTSSGPSPAPSDGPVPSGLPLGVDPGSSEQVVTVVAATSRATSALLTAWQLGPTGWTAVVGPVTARIGSSGVGRASEGSTRTPAGVFTLTEAFGRRADPGTALPYRVVDGDDWWVSDIDSPRYNRYAECVPGTCDFDERAGENLAAAGPVYDYAAVIDYNRGGARGAGSAFFLHVSNGGATAGCVAVDAPNLTTLLRWLTPASRPLIAIGVG
jgi:L,D-peptidoglycan transpeptidase YkuD (ErfK/YbiS/YcfS/YnhG family)